MASSIEIPLKLVNPDFVDGGIRSFAAKRRTKVLRDSKETEKKMK